ncbi:hypothetical protein HMPREF9336_04347 [Segniliparus rugosus ATCC BAA-974]|uniref:Uncharacterized protein n=1 Tax=Segniliparus rugosus (strain ATCC BAA-974 / DSM 45345 / CCUG 50838 / CIP 108380 / JCM 13579 / CDC 945) TaxID=679197 RepID=U1N8N6_SEGRC|nr:hypothetical protein HMPREF9336_04347 [Segniliparus rugosus ATCC BAA-974]
MVVMTTGEPTKPSRRDTRRRETLAEIKSLAREQLAEGGSEHCRCAG